MGLLDEFITFQRRLALLLQWLSLVDDTLKPLRRRYLVVRPRPPKAEQRVRDKVATKVPDIPATWSQPLYDQLVECTADIVGLRVVCFTKWDRECVALALQQALPAAVAFALVPLNAQQVQVTPELRRIPRTRYEAVHVDVRARLERDHPGAPTGGLNGVREVTVAGEIQVESVFGEAWHEFDHRHRFRFDRPGAPTLPALNLPLVARLTLVKQLAALRDQAEDCCTVATVPAWNDGYGLPAPCQTCLTAGRTVPFGTICGLV